MKRMSIVAVVVAAALGVLVLAVTFDSGPQERACKPRL
jgi:hypothetical protein